MCLGLCYLNALSTVTKVLPERLVLSVSVLSPPFTWPLLGVPINLSVGTVVHHPPTCLKREAGTSFQKLEGGLRAVLGLAFYFS